MSKGLRGGLRVMQPDYSDDARTYVLPLDGTRKRKQAHKAWRLIDMDRGTP